jgi:hypothetical protein
MPSHATDRGPVEHPAALSRWPRLQPLARAVEGLAHLLDSAVRIPGTRWRFGLDPILGAALPGAGDAIGGVLSLSVLFLALQYRVHPWVLLRMLGNIAIDAAVGGIPVLGDVLDFGIKANQRNLSLLRQQPLSAQPRPVSVTYWLFAALLVVMAAVVVSLPLLLVGYLLRRLAYGL